MQEKVTGLSTVSSQVGLNINKGKTKVLRINTGSDEPVILAAEPLEEVEDFVYLGSMVDKKGKRIWTSNLESQKQETHLTN